MTARKPDPAATGEPATEPVPQPAEQTPITRLAVLPPYDVFESGVDGVDPIRRAGTPVPDDLVEQVQQAAKQCGVHLHKTTEKG